MGRFRALWVALAVLLAPASAHAAAPEPAEIASAYVRANAPGIPLDDPVVKSLPGGLWSVRFGQSVDGVPVVDRDLRVNLAADGRVLNVLGDPAPVIDVDTSPALDAGDAVRAVQEATGVYRSLARRGSGYVDGTTAKLVIFADRLAWRVTYRTASDEVLDVLVDASSGDVLRQTNLVTSAAPASVWERYPGAALGGTAASVDLEALGYLPAGAANLTGPNAHAYSDLDDNDISTAGEEVARVGGSFTFALEPGSGTGCDALHLCTWSGSNWTAANRAQGTVQAFYFANRFHDHLASLGFGPEQGAFEGVDKLELNTFDGAATGPDGNHVNNANMFTPPDGSAPLMQMYLFRNPSFRNTHSGDDAAILYHEYAHGLSNRLVTDADGVGALNSPQSGAMGEAWSDWYALDYLVGSYPAIDTATAGEMSLGEYSELTGRIRTEGLDCPVGGDPVRCPGRGAAGTGGYTYGDFGRIVGSAEVHADGEIWAQTLWDLRSALGVAKTRSLVTSGMALLGPEPSFLDARNGILLADVALHAGANADAIWTVFARRGMGFFAASAGGGDTAPAESFALPPAAGAPRGTIAGRVTDGATGAPVAGVRIEVAGPDFTAVTADDGRYTLDVPAGTYVKVVASGGGYDRAVTSLSVAGGGTIQFSPTLRRNWAARAGGATVTDTNGGEFVTSGCGPTAAIDQFEGTGWSTGASASKYMVVRLAATVTVTQFALDPTETCGDSASSATGAYRIETSPDGTTWTTAVSGSFTIANRHQMNAVTPAAGATGVRFVRLTLLTSLGGPFKDLTEFAVYGTTGAADTTPPETILTGPFAFMSEPGATFECQLDDAPYAACTSPFVPGPLPDGVHTFSVRATDAAGNTDPTPATRTFTIDTTPPDTTLNGFAFTSSEPDSAFECRLGTAAFAPCTSPFVPGALPDGTHTFSVRARDAAGNVDPTPATRTFTIDTTAPTTAIDAAPATVHAGSLSFGVRSEPGATLACALDGGVYGPCGLVDVDALALGDHVFRARATDAAGNVGAVTEARFAVVNAAPVATLEGRFAIGGSDADGDALTYALDFGDGTSTTGTLPAAPLEHPYAAPGTYTVRLTVRDARTATTLTRELTVAADAPPPPQLALELSAPADGLGAFVPGTQRDYTMTVAATVSASPPARLTVVDPSSTAPGHLVNGDFALPSPLRVRGGPISGTPLALLTVAGTQQTTIEFIQPIAATDTLRAGRYAKALTFTLSTINP